MKVNKIKKWFFSDGGALAIVLGVVFLFVIAWNLLNCEHVRQWAIEHKGEVQFTGQLGDSMNILTCVFTFCALIGVVLNLRHEKEESRKRDIQTQLNEEQVRLDKVEGFYFKMLDSLRHMVVQWDVKNRDGSSIKGKEVLGSFLREVGDYVYERLPDEKFPTGTILYAAPQKVMGDPHKLVADIKEGYAKLYDDYPNKIPPYYRLMTMILEYVDSSKIPEEDRRRYIELFKSELSAAEVILLACEGNRDKSGVLKRLIERHHLISNLLDADTSTVHMFSKESFIKDYHVSAFDVTWRD